MQDLKKLINEVLQEGYVMTLATCKDNIPWAADVIYVHDPAFNLYWVSYNKARHSQELASNNIAAVDITVNEKGQDNKAVQIQGEASLASKEEAEKVAPSFYKKRNKPYPGSFEKVQEELQSRTWYKLTPTKIYLIYEPLFGYDRKEYIPK